MRIPSIRYVSSSIHLDDWRKQSAPPLVRQEGPAGSRSR